MRRRKRDRSTAGVRNQSENLLRYGDSKINVARVAVRDLRIRFASRRLDVVEILAANRLDKLTVDKILDPDVIFRLHPQRLSILSPRI